MDLYIGNEWGINPFFMLPRVDGEFINAPPEVLLKKKQYNKVDIIAGMNRDEGSFILSWLTKNPSLFRKLKYNFEKYGPLPVFLEGYPWSTQMAKKVYKFYLRDEFHSFSADNENLLKIFTDSYVGACHDKLIPFLADDEDISLYLYRLNHVGEYSFTDSVTGFKRKNYISHGDELYYLFNGGTLINATLKGEDIKFRNIINSLWRNYAITGNPSPKGSSVEWEKVEGRDELKELSLTTTPKMVNYCFQKRRKLWNSLRTKENYLLWFYKSHD